MVHQSPDNPHDCDDSLSTSDAGDIVIDNSSDEEDLAHLAGYVLLPQGPTAESSSSDSDYTDNGDEELADAQLPSKTPNIPNAEACSSGASEVLLNGTQSQTSDVQLVWSTPREQPNIELNSDQVNQVRAAMANFNLPFSSIPPWAADVPEEQWKERLLDRIQILQKGNDANKGE